MSTVQSSVTAGFTTEAGFELLQRMSNMFSKSKLVPEIYRNNIGDCAIAVNMAQRMHADPLMVMQNLYIVYGNPAWSSKFMIAMFNQCGRFSSIHYETVGKPGTDSYGCKAWAAELSTGERVEGPVVTIDIAKKEGWYQKKGSKWQTMPDQMLRYRAASWFIRTTAPELSMGLQTVDEAIDVGAETVSVEYAQHEIKNEIAEHANSKSIEQIAGKKEIPVKQSIPVKQVEVQQAPEPEPEPADGPTF